MFATRLINNESLFEFHLNRDRLQLAPFHRLRLIPILHLNWRLCSKSPTNSTRAYSLRTATALQSPADSLPPVEPIAIGVDKVGFNDRSGLMWKRSARVLLPGPGGDSMVAMLSSDVQALKSVRQSH